MSSASQSQVSAPIAVVTVREDHLAAIIRFISLQRTVVEAAVPRHLYGMQAEANKQLIELMPIIDEYQLAEDTTTITVDLDKGKPRKMLVSPKALMQNVNVMNEAKLTGDKKSDQFKGNDTVITETHVADTLAQPQVSVTNDIGKAVQTKRKENELKAQPARIAGGPIKVKVKPAPSPTAFPTAFPRAPMSHGQSTVQPGSTKPVIKQKSVTGDKIKQKSIPETRIPSNPTGSKRKQTSCSIDRQPAKRAKTDARIPAISLNGSATQGQINQAVRRGWNTRTQGRQDQREAVAWQKREHRFGSMVIERQ